MGPLVGVALNLGDAQFKAPSFALGLNVLFWLCGAFIFLKGLNS